MPPTDKPAEVGVNVPRAFNPARFSPVPPGMGELNYIQMLLAGILDQTLYTTSSPTFVNMILTGLTASMPVSTNASKQLATLTVAGFRTLLGLDTGDSPSFAGLTIGSVAGILKAAAGVVAAATIGTSLSYSAPTLDAIQDIRTSALPQFAGLNISHAGSFVTPIITVAGTSKSAQWCVTRGTNLGSWIGPSSGNTFDLWTQENINLQLATNNTAKLIITAAGLVNVVGTGALGIPNPAQTYYMRFTCGSALLADRVLTITPGDAARTITLSGNPTLADWFDQAVKAASSPTYAGLTLTGFSGFVKATAGVLSAAALVDGDIPDTITLTDITQITNRSHTYLSDIGTLTHATLDTYLDQAVKAASTPTFASLKLTTGAVVTKVWVCTNVDGSGAWTTAAAGGDILTDGAWAAAGDLIVGTGVDTAAILSRGTATKILTAGAAGISWEVPASQVSDTAYAASWDTVVDIAPSKNAVYDQMELRAPKANPVFTGNFVKDGLSSCILMAADITGYMRNLVVGSGLQLNLTTSTLTGVLPPGHLSGCAMTHAADTDHDITIAVGKARDSTDAADMVLASALTKQFDAAWAAGTNAGGMDTGSIPASGTLHIWAIKSLSTGVVDVLGSISATAPSMPVNFDYKRLIGSYRTNSSSNIINGDWIGTGVHRTFMFDTPVLDVSTNNPGTNAVTPTLSIPGGIIVKAILNLFVNSYTDGYVEIYLSALNNTDLAASASSTPLASLGWYLGEAAVQVCVISDTASRIRYRMDQSSANITVYIATIGYEMYL